MSWLPVYLDTSAILKLVLPESESDQMRHAMAGWTAPVSSSLSVVECARTLRRIAAPPAVRDRAARVLESMTLVRLDAVVLRLAETVGPRDLRTLDALHLATALSLGDMPEAFVTYDGRLAAAARRLRLTVVQPGA